MKQQPVSSLAATAGVLLLVATLVLVTLSVNTRRTTVILQQQQQQPDVVYESEQIADSPIIDDTALDRARQTSGWVDPGSHSLAANNNNNNGYVEDHTEDDEESMDNEDGDQTYGVYNNKNNNKKPVRQWGKKSSNNNNDDQGTFNYLAPEQSDMIDTSHYVQMEYGRSSSSGGLSAVLVICFLFAVLICALYIGKEKGFLPSGLTSRLDNLIAKMKPNGYSEVNREQKHQTAKGILTSPDQWEEEGEG